MAFVGKFGRLSSLDAGVASLKEIEENLIPEELRYIQIDDWYADSNGYDLNRLYFMIMGLQQVIIRNGGSLNFSRVKRIWIPTVSWEVK